MSNGLFRIVQRVSFQGLARLTCAASVCECECPCPACNATLHHRVLLRFFLRPLCRLGMLRFPLSTQNPKRAGMCAIRSGRECAWCGVGVELLEPMARISLVSGLKRCAVLFAQPPSSRHSSALFELNPVWCCFASPTCPLIRIQKTPRGTSMQCKQKSQDHGILCLVSLRGGR